MCEKAKLKLKLAIYKTENIVYNTIVVYYWRRSEAAVTRRTRNAFIGSSRYEGSNPSVSA